MRFFHISDLHIGKQLYFYNLIHNQRAILAQIVERAVEYRPDAILIAGDIYDKSIPSGEAYEVFDEFLSALAKIKPQIPVLIIAGNHDSAERLQYAAGFMEQHGIFISTIPPQEKAEHLKKIVLSDRYGAVNFYLLPFTKPGYVRHLAAEEDAETKTTEIRDYNSAIRYLIEREQIDTEQRNVLISHQFYVHASVLPETCESELAYQSVGGLDYVDTANVEQFDYVALGHIHGSQKAGRETIRYCGTPLKYSVSERNHQKSITLVEMQEKGTETQITEIPLVPLQDVRKEVGHLEEVLQRANTANREDFVSITLTNEEEIFNPKEKLEEYYPNLLEVRLDNSRTRQHLEQQDMEVTNLDPFEAFQEFYEEMNHATMDETELGILKTVVEKVRGEEA